jgi:hypothetical protein
MTLESIFYLLGIVYFVAGLIFLVGLLFVGLFAYLRFQRLKTEIAHSALVLGTSRIISSLSNVKTLPLLSFAPILLSGLKLFQQFRRRRG